MNQVDYQHFYKLAEAAMATLLQALPNSDLSDYEELTIESAIYNAILASHS